MFRQNHSHRQIPLTSHVDELPANLRKRLENSWAGTFYREFFCRLDEKTFATLYVDVPSRPNVPVNVLVGLEYLKAGNSWTDEEMYDHFCYDVQVRYAVGYRQLGEGYFDLRTLYYFRERLSRHMQEEGTNLLDQAFEQVTDKQIKAFGIKTGKQRMDSTQLASNIRQMGRVQLLVEVLQRVHRMLNENDQARYADLFAGYMKGHAGQYVYRLKGEEIAGHLQRIGEDMYCLLAELREPYASYPVYRVLERVFSEHFKLKEDKVNAKQSVELSASSLQSPDDLEATYREKGGKGHQGYAANVTETCDPKNDLQLITKVQVAPNNTDDSKLLAEALPNLKERTEIDTVYTDGGHGSPQTDEVLKKHQVNQIQTAIRGRQPDSERMHLTDFDIQFDDTDKPQKITCPYGQTVPVMRSVRRKAFITTFDLSVCQGCPMKDSCPSRPGKRDPRRRLRFTQVEANRAERRRRSEKYLRDGRNIRAAVEATMRSVKHPFPAGKLPVRGQFRVTCMVIGSAAMTNIRRIQRYLEAKSKSARSEKAIMEKESTESDEKNVFLLILASLSTFRLKVRYIGVF